MALRGKGCVVVSSINMALSSRHSSSDSPSSIGYVNVRTENYVRDSEQTRSGRNEPV